jgi:GNAT superfamily N-acetyltransferase
MTSPACTIEPVAADADSAVIVSALDLVLGGLPDDVRLQLREATLEAARRDPTALGELWRAIDPRGATVGAVWAQLRPGGTALVWPPQWRGSARPENPDPLLPALLAALEKQGVTLAQSLLGDRASPEAAALISCRFRHLADLCYLMAPAVSEPDEAANSVEAVEFAGVDAAAWPRLVELVEQTYLGTLDCPALDGLRDAADVLEEYRTIGDSGASLWRIVQLGGADIGCLLLADHPAQDQLELVYMGLVPAARGRDRGAAIVRHALQTARQRNRARVVLAVDAANGPALSTYARTGFVEFDRRAAYLYQPHSERAKS